MTGYNAACQSRFRLNLTVEPLVKVIRN